MPGNLSVRPVITLPACALVFGPGTVGSGACGSGRLGEVPVEVPAVLGAGYRAAGASSYMPAAAGTGYVPAGALAFRRPLLCV